MASRPRRRRRLSRTALVTRDIVSLITGATGITWQISTEPRRALVMAAFAVIAGIPLTNLIALKPTSGEPDTPESSSPSLPRLPLVDYAERRARHTWTA
jgi:hypothetical protein